MQTRVPIPPLTTGYCGKIDLEVSSTKTDFPEYSCDNWKMNGRLGSRIKEATV